MTLIHIYSKQLKIVDGLRQYGADTLWKIFARDEHPAVPEWSWLQQAVIIHLTKRWILHVKVWRHSLDTRRTQGVNCIRGDMPGCSEKGFQVRRQPTFARKICLRRLCECVLRWLCKLSGTFFCTTKTYIGWTFKKKLLLLHAAIPLYRKKMPQYLYNYCMDLVFHLVCTIMSWTLALFSVWASPPPLAESCLNVVPCLVDVMKISIELSRKTRCMCQHLWVPYKSLQCVTKPRPASGKKWAKYL
jgi:hypothetical protein